MPNPRLLPAAAGSAPLGASAATAAAQVGSQPRRTVARVHARAPAEEPPTELLQSTPVHARRYASLLGGRVEAGPAFTFPEALPRPVDTVVVTDLAQLQRNFRGWTANELPERSPILALTEDAYPVSVCFCARRSDLAAEAGVETAERCRGRGLGARVTAAWALAIRSAGRLPLSRTSWSNQPSLAVARKLGLTACASDWSLYV